MSLLKICSRIAVELGQSIPDLRSCSVHGGRFDLHELRRLAAKLPCIRVTCLGVPTVSTEGGTLRVESRFAAYVLARDCKDHPRGAQAMLITEAVLGCIAENRWSLDCAGRPTDLRAENLYSGGLDSHGVALWAVTWIQAFDLDPAVALSAFRQMEAVFLTGSQASKALIELEGL